VPDIKEEEESPMPRDACKRNTIRISTIKIPEAIHLLLSLLLVFWMAGCGQKDAKVIEERTFNVQVQRVEKKNLRPYIETVGSLKPFEVVIFSSEVDGILHEIRVNEGTPVSRGTLLAVIDERDYRNEATRAEAAVKQAEATLANTKLEFQRKDALFKEELVTRQQYDDVTTRLAIAEADVERAKAARTMAKERLDITRIYSPLGGFVQEKKQAVGNYVRNGTPIFTIVQTHPLKLDFTVTEKEISKLKTGQDVIFSVDTHAGQEFTGKLKTIYPALEDRTRTLQVEALVPNPQNVLKPGLFAKVRLYTNVAVDTVVIPVTSIIYENSSTKVFIAEGDRAKERKIRIGNKYGETVEVTEGLQGEETIVVVGQRNLAEGVKLNVAR
jgi:membrane fusion protein (multidrug efflux system)